MNSGERGGNAGPWETRETKTRFPSFPPALGNRSCDFHIPTAPATTVYPYENEPTKPKERSPAPRQPDFSPSGSFLD